MTARNGKKQKQECNNAEVMRKMRGHHLFIKNNPLKNQITQQKCEQIISLLDRVGTNEKINETIKNKNVTTTNKKSKYDNNNNRQKKCNNNTTPN